MSAIISPDGLYRYRLERTCGMGLPVAVIMVNPSTADATEDDATIRKLKGFARTYGWGRIIVGNLFAYRATDVRELGKVDDPVGPHNDRILTKIMREEVSIVVFAWGPLAKQPKAFRRRWREVHQMVVDANRGPFCLGEPCVDGHPRHPLLTPYADYPRLWTPPSK